MLECRQHLDRTRPKFHQLCSVDWYGWTLGVGMLRTRPG